MQVVLVDMFVVPQESKSEFVAGTIKIQAFIRTLPGFVEGYLYDQTGGENPYNFLTTAVWENEEAFENAKKSVPAEHQRIGFNSQETRKRLKIETVRSEYRRSPY